MIYRLFALLSNSLAWLLVGLGALIAVFSPVAIPIYARMNSLAVPISELAEISLWGALTSIGSFLVLKRRGSGVVLLVMAGATLLIYAGPLVAASFTMLILVMLGIPVALYKTSSKKGAQ